MPKIQVWRIPVGHVIAAGALLALAFTAVTVEFETPVSRREPHIEGASPPGLGSVSSPEADQAMRALPTSSAPERVAIAVISHLGEDELTLRWSEFSPEARVRELHEQCRGAMDAMQRGLDFDANRAKADAAVSALRAELYGTPSGRKEHERLEQRLQALVERERGRSEPGREEAL